MSNDPPIPHTLLPCPFCGGEAKDGGIAVACLHCGGTGPLQREWNLRVNRTPDARAAIADLAIVRQHHAKSPSYAEHVAAELEARYPTPYDGLVHDTTLYDKLWQALTSRPHEQHPMEAVIDAYRAIVKHQGDDNRPTSTIIWGEKQSGPTTLPMEEQMLDNSEHQAEASICARPQNDKSEVNQPSVDLVLRLDKLAAHIEDMDSGSGDAALLREAIAALQRREIPYIAELHQIISDELPELLSDNRDKAAAKIMNRIKPYFRTPKPVMSNKKELEEVRQTLVSVRNNIYICRLEYDQVERCIAKLSAILGVENVD